eukprot:365-Heterococcus_DN1.PRE.1
MSCNAQQTSSNTAAAAPLATHTLNALPLHVNVNSQPQSQYSPLAFPRVLPTVPPCFPPNNPPILSPCNDPKALLTTATATADDCILVAELYSMQ